MSILQYSDSNRCCVWNKCGFLQIFVHCSHLVIDGSNSGDRLLMEFSL